MTTADSCPTKMLYNSTVCHRRIATHVLVIPGQTVASRREPPSPRAQIGFTPFNLAAFDFESSITRRISDHQNRLISDLSATEPSVHTATNQLCRVAQR
jgi:hypothetical protein